MDREIPKEAVETMSLEQIFMRFATKEHTSRVGQFQRLYWDFMRAISINSNLELHLPSKEKSQTDTFTYHPNNDSHREVMNALLEAERHKARAIMYYERRRLDY